MTRSTVKGWPLVFLATAFLICSSVPAVFAQVASGPTVGDPIAIDVDLAPGERIELLPSDGIELVEQRGDAVIVRGFRPGPAELVFSVTDESGATREVRQSIEIASVLPEDDELEPAPLSPPIAPPANRVAWIAIGIAAAGAALVWLRLLWWPRSRTEGKTAELSAAAEYLRVIEQVKRMAPSDARFSTLSDATRRFLSRIDGSLGRELTSHEVMDRLRGRFPEWLVNDVRDVLDEGDYAKFSPWGGRLSRFDIVIKEANDLSVLDREGRAS